MNLMCFLNLLLGLDRVDDDDDEVKRFGIDNVLDHVRIHTRLESFDELDNMKSK